MSTIARLPVRAALVVVFLAHPGSAAPSPCRAACKAGKVTCIQAANAAFLAAKTACAAESVAVNRRACKQTAHRGRTNAKGACTAAFHACAGGCGGHGTTTVPTNTSLQPTTTVESTSTTTSVPIATTSTSTTTVRSTTSTTTTSTSLQPTTTVESTSTTTSVTVTTSTSTSTVSSTTRTTSTTTTTTVRSTTSTTPTSTTTTSTTLPGPTCGDAEAPGVAGITSAHDAVRADPSLDSNGVPQPAPSPPLSPLCYSASVAAVAQSWANGCMFMHNANRGSLGENIYAVSDAGSTMTPGDAVTAWAAEAQYFDYATTTCSAPNPPGTCLHYTQVVWRDTTALGCGRTFCTTNSPFGAAYPTWTFVVCDYQPPGNVELCDSHGMNCVLEKPY